MNVRPMVVTFALAAIPLAIQQGIAPIQAHAGPPDGEWRTATVGPIPRTSFAMVYDSQRHRLIAFGGDAGNGVPMQDTWVLPLAQDSSWRLLVPSGPSPPARLGHCMVYDSGRDRVLLFGGYHAPDHLNDMWFLDLSGTLEWRQFGTYGTPPAGRHGAVAVYDSVNQRMVLYGGLRNNYLNDFWELSLNTTTPTWTLISATGGKMTARAWPFYAHDTKRNAIVLFGGLNSTGNLGDTWERYLGPGGFWNNIQTVNTPGNRRLGPAIYDPSHDRVVIFGGVATTILADAWQLPRTPSPDWTPLTPTADSPIGRWGAEMEYDPVQNRMVMLGGFQTVPLSDTWSFDLNGTNEWRRFSGNDIPPRRAAAAAYNPDAQEMLVFGGLGALGDLDDAWSLELSLAPLFQPWKQVRVQGARPSPRHAHGAVWDAVRHRFLVFGGVSGTQYFNDLWELTLAPTPIWTQITTQGIPPQPRAHFEFAVDPIRDRLILFGGIGTGIGYRNDVWSLPLSGSSALTWAQLVVSGLPPVGRTGSSMCYEPFRDRMTLFGGQYSLGLLSDLWSLGLAGSPTWIQIGSAGPGPSPRFGHAMVYDPNSNRMVVFGGNRDVWPNDTWALNLSGGYQWQQLSPVGVPPSGREDIAAIYEPLRGRMVMFGGRNGSGVLSDTWQLEWGPPSTSVTASLLESHAQPDRVHLAWYVRDAASVQALVERRSNGAEWSSLGAPAVERGEILRYEDTDVVPCARYGYRLRLRPNGEETLTSETEIEVPRRAMLELAGAQPNPTQGGPLRVSFSLSQAGDGHLELLDVSGRRVASRSLDGLEPGTHHLVFLEASRAEPGVYLLRLVTSERTLTAKALVTR